MIDFQLVVQHRAAGVLTSTNFNLDALVGQPTQEAWTGPILCVDSCQASTKRSSNGEST
jgi:hypothetical protein